MKKKDGMVKNKTKTKMGKFSYSYSYSNYIIPLALFFLLPHLVYSAVKVKDVSKVAGLSELQLNGFGLVVGLRNTGDSPRSAFTSKGVVNMLRNLGMEIPMRDVRLRNVAAVMVSGSLHPFASTGSHMDVLVSSIGDARSLEGGTLLLTSLTGPDGILYAMAQGPISVGGLQVDGLAGLSTMRKNHALAGRVPNGGLVQKELAVPFPRGNSMEFNLSTPDFSSAVRMAEAINSKLGGGIAKAKNSATVVLTIDDSTQNNPMPFLSTVENVEFEPSIAARVVLNEKTGTIVAGGDLAISPVAVSHGNITIQIEGRESNQSSVVQGPKQTSTVTNRDRQETQDLDEPKTEMKVLPQVTNVNELASALNSLGVSPRDIISIFRSLKQAGALHAELIIL